MDKIRELQDKLKTLYKQENKYVLSERSVVSIILKLLERGDLSLVYSSDGREYITPDHLETMILRELEFHKGRIEIHELETLLNVNADVLEGSIQKMLIKRQNISFVDRQLISKTYLNNLADEINERLQENDSLETTELNSRFSLSYTFILDSIIKKQLGSRIQGILDGSMLYTDSFIESYKRKIKSSLAATTVPINMTSIRNRFNLSSKLFDTIIQGMVENNEICGAYQPQLNTYTPSIYHKARTNWISTFFKKNGFIDYQMVSKIGITNPAKYMTNEFGDQGFALSESFVSKKVIDDIDDAIKEVLSAQDGDDLVEWVDVKSLIHFPVTRNDMSEIIKRCSTLKADAKKKEPQLKTFGETFVVSQALINKFLQQYEEHIKKTISLQPAKTEELTIVSPEEEEEVEEEEENPRARGKGKGGRGAKRTTRATKKTTPKKTNEAVQGSESVGQISSNLVAWYKKGKQDDEIEHLEDVCRHIASQLKPTLDTIRQRESQALFKEEATGAAPVLSLKDRIKQFQNKFKILHFNLQLFNNAIQELSDGYIKATLSNYLLTTLCQDAVNMIFENQALHYEIPLPPLNPDKPEDTLVKTAEDRTHILESLPKQIQAVLKNLNSSINSKQISKFFDTLEPVAKECEFMVKPLDKKSAKTLVMTHTQDSIRTLSSTTDPLVSLHLVLSLFYIYTTQSVLYVSTDNLDILLDILKSKVGPTIHSELVECHKKLGTIKELESKNENGEIENLKKQVNGLIEKLKPLALDKKANLSQ